MGFEQAVEVACDPAFAAPDQEFVVAIIGEADLRRVIFCCWSHDTIFVFYFDGVGEFCNGEKLT